MSSPLRFGHVEVRSGERQLLVDGQPAALGARAFDLLLALIEHRDRVVSKNELLDLVWPGLVVEENNLQVQISALRKLLGAKAISTIPGRGYRLRLRGRIVAQRQRMTHRSRNPHGQGTPHVKPAVPPAAGDRPGRRMSRTLETGRKLSVGHRHRRRRDGEDHARAGRLNGVTRRVPRRCVAGRTGTCERSVACGAGCRTDPAYQCQ